jgi:CRP-like cAMP-binding protein
LLCELHTRLEVVGLADTEGFALALTQTEFAECVGLTPVHVNRTLRKLREQGLVDFRGGRVTVLDRPGLERVAEFKRDYLYLDPYPR